MALAQDHHIHTVYSGHGSDDMTVANIVRRAEAIGLRRLVILEHVPVGREVTAFRRGELARASRAHLDRIAREIAACRRDSPVLLFLGAEVDADPHRRDGRLALDDLGGVAVVFAATHAVPGLAASPWDLEGLPEEVVLGYYEEWIVWAFHVAANPAVDVLAHPGRAMTALGAIPAFEGRFLEDFEKLLKICRRYETAIDVNETYLAQLDERQRATYLDVLALARDLGVKLSLGSDAHTLEGVGTYRYVDEAVTALGLEGKHYYHPRPRAGSR